MPPATLKFAVYFGDFFGDEGTVDVMGGGIAGMRQGSYADLLYSIYNSILKFFCGFMAGDMHLTLSKNCDFFRFFCTSG